MAMAMVMVMQSGAGGGTVGKHNRMPTMSERSLAPDYTGTPHLLTDELQSMSTKLLALRELDAVMIERLRLFGYLCPQCLCLCLCSFRTCHPSEVHAFKEADRSSTSTRISAIMHLYVCLSRTSSSFPCLQCFASFAYTFDHICAHPGKVVCTCCSRW